MRTSVFLLVALIWCNVGIAQKRNNVWCFGNGAGIDFNTSPPTPFTSQINTIEEAASVSDRRTGKLLFYTDGATVWSADHSIMPFGVDIGVDPNVLSSINGAVIVPFIGDDDKYYIFSLSTGRDHPGELYYSVVDMKLNGGKGDVVQDQKKIRIAGTYTEAMVVMQNCETIWVVTQLRADEGADFYAYSISEAGIDITPVVSPIGHAQKPYFESGLYASADNSKLVSLGNVFSSGRGDAYIALYDFDMATGKLSNPTIIDEDDNAVTYNCAFSPNGKRLYTTSRSSVYQYDLSLATPSAIRASRTSIGTSTCWLLNGMCRRDDGNIYIIRNESGYLDMISNADALYPDCIFTDKAVEIGGRGTYGIPPMIADGSVDVYLGNDTLLCNGGSIELHSAGAPNGAKYKWSTGDTTSSIVVSNGGTYELTVSYNGCAGSDDVDVNIKQPISIDLGDETEICKNSTLLLPAISTTDTGDKYLWQDGSTDRTFTVREAGVYRVTVSNECDTITDMLVVTERNCHFFFPSAFSPNGDGRNDIAHLVGDAAAVTNYSLHIINRWGEAVFHTKDATKGWDGTYKGQKAEMGTYFYIIKYTHDGEEEMLKGDLALIR